MAVLRELISVLSFFPHLPSPRASSELRIGTAVPVDIPPPIRLRPVNAQCFCEAKSPKARNWPLEDQLQIPDGVGVQSAARHHALLGRGCGHPMLLKQVICMRLDAESSTTVLSFPQTPQTTGFFFIIIESSIVTTPFEPDREVMDILKEIYCRRLPLYPTTSIPVLGADPTDLIIRMYHKGSLWSTGQSFRAVCPAEEKTGLHLPKSCMGHLGSHSWWCWEPLLGFLLRLGFLNTGSWPCLPPKAIT